MIFEHSVTYPVPKLQKVFKFFPAFNDSIVLQVLAGVGKEAIQQYNKDGKKIFEHQFNDLIDAVSMPNEHEVLVLRPEEQNGIVYHFNLLNHSIKKFPHLFQTDVSCQCYMDFFCESNLLAIYEHGDHYQVQAHFTYYNWPLQF